VDEPPERSDDKAAMISPMISPMLMATVIPGLFRPKTSRRAKPS
jgi:hypothetical protein